MFIVVVVVVVQRVQPSQQGIQFDFMVDCRARKHNRKRTKEYDDAFCFKSNIVSGDELI
jgi:hypothetical protein